MNTIPMIKKRTIEEIMMNIKTKMNNHTITNTKNTKHTKNPKTITMMKKRNSNMENDGKNTENIILIIIGN